MGKLKLDKNNNWINKIKKNGIKIVAVSLGTILVVSGWNNITKNDYNNYEQNETSYEQNVEEDKTATIEIRGREYVFDNEGVTHFVRKSNERISDIADDLKIDYLKLLEVADKDLDSDKLNKNAVIEIPREIFNNSDGKKMGIYVNSDLGKIDWEKISFICDFAYIDCYDFKNYSYDDRFKENIEGCEKYNIPYGIVISPNVKSYEDIDDASYQDAKFIHKILKEYNATMPVILRVTNDETIKQYKENINENGELIDFINSEDSNLKLKGEKYCGRILTKLKYKFHDFPILYTDYYSYLSLYEAYEDSLASKEADEKKFKDNDYYHAVSFDTAFCHYLNNAEGQILRIKYHDEFFGVLNTDDDIPVFYDNTGGKVFYASEHFRENIKDMRVGITEFWIGSCMLYFGTVSIFLNTKYGKKLDKKIKEIIGEDELESEEIGTSFKKKRKNKKK